MTEEPAEAGRRAFLAAAPAAALALAAEQAQAQAPAYEVPGLELVFTAHVMISPIRPIGDIPAGQARIAPITGGTFEGPRLRGKVMAGGADWQISRPDGVTELRAHYGLECDDGAIIQVKNNCLVTPKGPPAAGQARAPTLIRSVMTFEAPKPHDWLNRAVFVGTLNAPGDTQAPVVIRCFQVT
jgi:hypothetical protein